MNTKRDRLSGRAARYAGDRRFPRVVPETGLLRFLGRSGKPAHPEPDAAKQETEQAAAGK